MTGAFDGRRVLVTGAAGFVGANLVRRLLAEGAEVHAFVRATTDPWRLQAIRHRLSIHDVDLRDAPRVRAAVGDVRPDIVCHLAKQRGNPAALDPQAADDTNLQATRTLLDAAERGGVRRFIHAGSSLEYGSLSGPRREDATPVPTTPHGITKVAATAACLEAARTSAMHITVLRLFTVYGPWENPERFVPTLMRAALDDGEIAVAGPGLAHDWIYVGDVVGAFVAAAASTTLPSGELINVATGRQHTNEDLVAATERAIGRRVRVSATPYPARVWDTTSWVADVSKAARVLGWQARTSLDDGIRRTLRAANLVSVVVPVYQNAETLEELHERVCRAVEGAGRDVEVVYVNDACPAGSDAVLDGIAARDVRARVVTLAANGGQHRALLAGFRETQGRTVISLDADLQDPPEAIASLLSRLDDGFDVAFAGRRGRYQSVGRHVTSRAYKQVLHWTTGLPADAGLYLAMRRPVLDRLLQQPAETAPVVTAMIAAAGGRLTSIPVARARRPQGTSAYSSWDRVALGVRALTTAAACRPRRRR